MSIIICLISGHSFKQPVITYFGLHEATDIAFIGTNINLSCIMENAEVACFLNSGNPVAESERVTYFFKVLVMNCTAILKSLK